MSIGDVFVIQSEAGLYWDGKGWVAGWSKALQFGYPGFGPCEQAADEARQQSGTECFPVYIPAITLKSIVRKERQAGAGLSAAGVGA